MSQLIAECAPSQKATDTLLADVRKILVERQVVSLGLLVRLVGHDSTKVCEALDHWIQSGQVECLRPAACLNDSVSGEYVVDLVYYRWRQASDRDHVWQAQLARRSCRFFPSKGAAPFGVKRAWV